MTSMISSKDTIGPSNFDIFQILKAGTELDENGCCKIGDIFMVGKSGTKINGECSLMGYSSYCGDLAVSFYGPEGSIGTLDNCNKEHVELVDSFVSQQNYLLIQHDLCTNYI